MRKSPPMSMIGWNVTLKHCDEEYPWDVKVNRMVKIDGSELAKYELEFDKGYKVYINADDISWFTYKKPIEKIMEGATVVRLRANNKRHLRLIK